MWATTNSQNLLHSKSHLNFESSKVAQLLQHKPKKQRKPHRGMGTTEDFSFSFPISEPGHSPVDSPPLWTLSPAASPAYRLQRKSSSYLEAGGLINIRRLRLTGGESDTQEEDDNEDEEDEDKMDMMWEAWNDEISKHRRQIMMDLHTTNTVLRSKSKANKILPAANTPSNNVAEKKAKTKKSSMLVKVLKKLFLLHQSASSKSNSQNRS